MTGMSTSWKYAGYQPQKELNVISAILKICAKTKATSVVVCHVIVAHCGPFAVRQ